MPRRALRALLTVCLLPLACTTSSTTKPDADEPKPSSDADSSVSPIFSDTDPPEDDDDIVRASPTPVVELPDCPPEPEPLVPYCTEANKLAGHWMPVDMLKIPDGVVVIFNAEGPDSSKQTSLLIATHGDALYIRHVTCGGCRRVLGQGFVGHPSHMSEAQVRALQTQLGLDKDAPLLDSADQWARYCSDPHGKAALTKIAGKAEGEAGGRGR